MHSHGSSDDINVKSEREDLEDAIGTFADLEEAESLVELEEEMDNEAQAAAPAEDYSEPVAEEPVTEEPAEKESVDEASASTWQAKKHLCVAGKRLLAGAQ